MDELTLDDKKYLSSKRAAQITGYAKDYVGQLCREGRVTARLVGRNWYVLEESILEHRFGAEDNQINSPEESDPKASEALPTTWEAPKYIPEPPQLVPELRPKAVPDAQAALADMQSAWKEWSTMQKEEEKMLPDPSEMLLEAPEELLAPQEESEVAEEPPANAIEEELISVHIERHNVAAAPLMPPSNPEPESVVVAHSYVRPQIEEKRGRRKSGKTPRSKGHGSVVLRAALISLAGLAIAVTVIGTGIADSYFERITSTPVSDFISGIKLIDK